MTTYVALLRGIAPTNPNMHGAALQRFFESLGLRNVQTVISSGNVIFESPSQSAAALEERIETALPKKLGFRSLTIIRTKKELEELVRRNPFKGKTHSTRSYLLVTFLKDKKRSPGGVVCTPFDNTSHTTPATMAKIEKKFDKAVTSRTWKTVERILARMG